MNRPLCSIVIPAYNVERYVAAAVESALAQTYEPVEVIVVNDGSTDGTAGALAPFTDRIVYIEQANRGLAGARNSGIREARGAFVGFLDADDAWFAERLDKCVGELDRSPEVGFVTTDALIIEGDEPTDRHFYGDLAEPGFPAPDDQLATLADHNFMFVGAVVRRELLDRHGVFDEHLRRSEDYDLWLRFCLAGEHAALVNEPLAWYRLRGDSLSADRHAQWAAHLTVIEKHLSALRARGIRGRAGDAYDIAVSLSGRGEHRKAAAFFAMVARDPSLGARSRAKSGARALLERARRESSRPA